MCRSIYFENGQNFAILPSPDDPCLLNFLSYYAFSFYSVTAEVKENILASSKSQNLYYEVHKIYNFGKVHPVLHTRVDPKGAIKS